MPPKAHLGLLLLKARTAAVLAALIGLLACEGIEAPNALGLSPAWMMNINIISTLLPYVSGVYLRQKFVYAMCICQICPSARAFTQNGHLQAVFAEAAVAMHLPALMMSLVLLLPVGTA